MSTFIERVLEVVRAARGSKAQEDAPDRIIRIRANIGGFSGDPVSLRAALDSESGRIRIASEHTVELKDRPGWVLLSNLPLGDQRVDVRFSQDDLRDAIGSYFSLEQVGMIGYADGMERVNPSSKIEADGMDERGRVYRIRDDCGNRHVAVLAVAWLASRQTGLGAVVEAFDDLYGPLDAQAGDGFDAYTC